MKTDVVLSFFHGLISCPVVGSVFGVLHTDTDPLLMVGSCARFFDICVPSCCIICTILCYSWFLATFQNEDEWPDQLSRVWGDAKL